jgi:hypothetical protein
MPACLTTPDRTGCTACQGPGHVILNAGPRFHILEHASLLAQDLIFIHNVDDSDIW